MRTREALARLWLGAIATLLAAAGWVLHAKLTHGARGGLHNALVALVAVFALATLAAIVWAYVRPYARHAGAILLDRAFDNRDRVTSALSFGALPANERTPLMDAAIDDAVVHAKPLAPSVAAPLLVAILTGDAAFAVVLALLVGGLGTLQWSRTIAIPRAQTIDAISLSADDIELFHDTLEQLAQKDPSPETQAALHQFNQLVEDIAQKRLDRAEAFRRMESLEKALAKGRDADAKALDDALKSTADKLKDSPLSKPAGDALAKKDFAATEKELKELAKKLRDKQSKITEADKKRLKEALSAASKKQKETLARLAEQREQLKASLLAREQKAGSMNDEEKRLLNRDKRELDRLDREIADKEKAGRQLDRLDRELSQAAEDLLRELGLSADDLDKAAEDINRMAKEEMTEQEKEELRQRLQELKELLRQEGKGGEELRKRLRKFAKKAHGKGDQGEQEEGAGKKKGDKGDKGKKGEGEGEEDGEDGEDGEKGKGKKGKGGEGEGEGEGPGGKKSFVLKSGNRPGQGPGVGVGAGQPGGSGEKGAGKQFGTGHDPNVAGKGSNGKMTAQQDVQEAATDTGQGPSVSETILSSSEKGFASRPYKKVYADYRTKAEEAMKNEDIPPGYKFYVQRYFQLIRPRE